MKRRRRHPERPRPTLGQLSPLALLALLSLAPAMAQDAEPIEARGSVAFEDPAGDMGMISTSGDPEPPLDIVGLAIETDGERITVTATLAGEPGTFADSVVTLYIDADDDPATGVNESSVSPAGFDHELNVQLCMAYDNGASACAGGTDGTVTERWAAVDLERFEGDHPYGPSTDLIGTMFAGDLRKSEKWPVDGLAVSASILYSDIGLTPGDTIRILAREASGSPKEGDDAFPIVRLTLE